MQSPVLHNFQEFLTWMKKYFWNNNYNPTESSCHHSPSEYPCIVINEFYMDSDNRERDHFHYITLSDFDFADIEKYYKEQIYDSGGL